MDFKICVKCSVEKPTSEFHKHPSAKYGVRADCSECVALYSKAYRKKNRDLIKEKKKIYHQENPEVKRRSYLKKTYRLTEEEYSVMFKEQNGVCAICGENKITSQHRNLYIDHCHKTGKVRELLCHACNTAIGLSKESISRLEGIIQYLKKHEQQRR